MAGARERHTQRGREREIYIVEKAGIKALKPGRLDGFLCLSVPIICNFISILLCLCVNYNLDRADQTMDILQAILFWQKRG